MTDAAEQQAIKGLIDLNSHPKNTDVMRPKFINGHIVLCAYPREFPGATGALWVAIDRGRDSPRYVVATWAPVSPGSWSWGHYVKTAQQARDYLRGKGVPV
ncbi:hypothetical protein [uncultured Ruegeria sp.]|uniref:hypothetical protein n=1 Tax=uncultured Ruegeria sp. TaxID=259304 RepID=UPI00261A593C|nr:hypothetical protein [uncultured Ruegeria sp.]